MKATAEIVGGARGGGAIRVRLPEGIPIEETLGDDGATVRTLSEPGLVDGRLGGGIVKEGELSAGEFADGRLIEFKSFEGTLPDGSVDPRGRTVATVVEGATKLTSVLGGKSIDGKLPDGTLIEGIVAEDMPIEPRLLDGSAIEFNPTDTRGTLTGATLGTVT